MKKKVILFVSALLCMFSLCACGSSGNEPTTYNGVTPEQIQATMASTAESLVALSDDECKEYYDYYSQSEDGEVMAGLMSDWMEIKDEAGEFEAFTDFEVTKAGKTLSAVLSMSFTGRDVNLTYVINAHNMEVTAVNAELVYSLGEKMSKALLNTVMGISVVFVILVLIALCIYAFRIIPVLQEKFSKKDAVPEKDKKIVVQEKAVAEEDDAELIAVIAAAIAASTGASTDDFVVRSIRRRY